MNHLVIILNICEIFNSWKIVARRFIWHFRVCSVFSLFKGSNGPDIKFFKVLKSSWRFRVFKKHKKPWKRFSEFVCCYYFQLNCVLIMRMGWQLGIFVLKFVFTKQFNQRNVWVFIGPRRWSFQPYGGVKQRYTYKSLLSIYIIKFFFFINIGHSKAECRVLQ